MSNLFRLIPYLCAAAPMALAQTGFHFGIEAGVPLTDTLVSSESTDVYSTSPLEFDFDRYNSVTKRLLIGPSFRVDIHRGIGIEFDALYQRVDYDFLTTSVQPGYYSQTFQKTSGNRWQFPLLIQYAHPIPIRTTSVFVEGGYTVSRIGDVQSNMNSISGSSSSSSSGPGTGVTTAGFVAGAGVDLRVFRIHARPEFRYTHWFLQNNTGAVAYGAFGIASATVTSVLTTTSSYSGFNLRANEASFQFGLSW